MPRGRYVHRQPDGVSRVVVCEWSLEGVPTVFRRPRDDLAAARAIPDSNCLVKAGRSDKGCIRTDGAIPYLVIVTEQRLSRLASDAVRESLGWWGSVGVGTVAAGVAALVTALIVSAIQRKGPAEPGAAADGGPKAGRRH